MPSEKTHHDSLLAAESASEKSALCCVLALAHILRHIFATTLVRGGTNLVLVAELLGHAQLETTRGYTRPTAVDRLKAIDGQYVNL